MKISHLVCLGDSITWGYPFGPDYSWVKISAGFLGFPLTNHGINGDTAEDLLRRFERDVISKSPSHVFIMVGTNDASINVSPENYLHSVSAMCDRAVANSIVPIIGMPVPSADRWLELHLGKYRTVIKEYTAERGIRFIDFSQAMLAGDGSIFPGNYTDEVHPSLMGYRSMAEIFIKDISFSLKE